MSLERSMKRRLVVVCLALVTGLSLLSVRLVYLQISGHEKYSKAAIAHYTHREILPSQRGRIYSANGDLLARSQMVYALVVNCHHVRDPLGHACWGMAKKYDKTPRQIRREFPKDEITEGYLAWIVKNLAQPLRFQPDVLAKMLEKETGYVVLGRGIEEDECRELKELMESAGIGGIYFRQEERRYYPSPLTLTHVVGYVGEKRIQDEFGNEIFEIEGKEGIEKIYDEVMQGERGFRHIERDSQKQEIHAFRGQEKLPKAGKNVHLTIDMSLQVEVEEILDQVVSQYNPEKVTAIWMDPRTGEILAMASRPHFDLATRKPEGARRNLAITDIYEPGSTFKVVGIGAALDRGLISPATEIDCHWGAYNGEGYVLKDHHPYGILTSQMVLAKSSNIGVYMISRQLNGNTFMEYVRSFGFGRPTGIELTAERAGTLHPVDTWSRTSFSSTAMGYSIGVTPLQMIQAYGAIANDGVLPQPTVLAGIEDPETKTMTRPERSPKQRVISERAAAHLRRMLVSVTEEGGTGTRAHMPGYLLAGKTGTAKKHVPGYGYADGRYVVSFAGFLPADNPKLLGLVVVDDPRAEGMKLYGGTVAAPIFKEMAGKAVQIRGIAPVDAEEYRLAEFGSQPPPLTDDITD